MKIATVNRKPKSVFPLPPDDPKIDLQDEDQGPFVCINCKFYRGSGKPCPKQTAPLRFGKCCSMYKAVPLSRRKSYEDLITLRDQKKAS